MLCSIGFMLALGQYCLGRPAFIPATPLGVLEILKRCHVPTFGKTACVVGRSKNIGEKVWYSILCWLVKHVYLHDRKFLENFREIFAVNKFSWFSRLWSNREIKICEVSFTRKVFHTWHKTSTSILKYFETVGYTSLAFHVPPSPCPPRVPFNAQVCESDSNEIFAVKNQKKPSNRENKKWEIFV